MLLTLAAAAAAQSLLTTGACGGAVTLSVSALESDRAVVLIGSGPGAAVAPGTPCGDLATGLDTVRAVTVLPAADGEASVVIEGPPGGRWLQAVDPDTCSTSRVVPLCPREPALVGSFRVTDGARWDTDPPTRSCVEACALVFGGYPSEWACSTRDWEVDHLAYVDGWADDTYCTSPLPEHFKLNATYNCGFAGCSYSAYVDDHSCESVNSCFAL